MESVPACFVFRDQVTKDTSGYRLSKACEESTGPNGIEGVQWLNGLIRIYTRSTEARNKLLMKGITLDKIHIPVIGTNPKIVEGPEDTVKLIVGQIPLSLANSEIEKALTDMSDVRIKSRMFYEHYRDDDGKLTSYKSGRRFLYIVKPANPLPKTVQIMKWKASLYHFGQKRVLAARDSNLGGAATSQNNEMHTRVAVTDNAPIDPPTTQNTPECSASPPPASEEREVNQQSTLEIFFRKPSKMSNVSSPAASRGRTRSRQHQRSRSVSLSRKRGPSDEERLERSWSKSRREQGPTTTTRIDYFDFDPTKDAPTPDW